MVVESKNYLNMAIISLTKKVYKIKPKSGHGTFRCYLKGKSGSEKKTVVVVVTV